MFRCPTLRRAVPTGLTTEAVKFESIPDNRGSVSMPCLSTDTQMEAGENRLRAGLEAWAAAQARFEASFGGKRAAEMRTLLKAVAASQFTPTDHDARQ